jgi:alkanesulfonate monooxygenase SsuD/methylene tetrahydromethanopterin reductase-like flavin-dependent oxidoreductase (luciferase family)
MEVWIRQSAPFYYSDDEPTPFPVPGWMWDRKRGEQMYADRMQFIRRVDELGFDAILFTEHHYGPNGGLMASPPVLLAAASQVTERIKLATMGIALALYPQPVRVAEELAMIDNLCHGRLVVGFISGTPQNLYAYNVPVAEERERYHEAYDLIVKAWTEENPFPWHSEYYDYECVSILPRPLQEPHPPIWTTATSAESIQWAASKQISFISHGPTVEAAERLGFYQRYAETQCGWSPGAANLGIAREFYIGPTMEKVEEMVNLVFEQDRAHSFTHRRDNPSLAQIDRERAERRSYDYLTTVDKPFQGAAATVEGRRTGQFLVGDPDAMIEEITAQQKATGAGVLVIRPEMGSMSLQEVTDGLDLFAREVLPIVQKL